MYIEYDKDKVHSLISLPVKIILCSQLIIFIEEEFIDGILKFKYLGSLQCILDDNSLLIINQLYPTTTHYMTPPINSNEIGALKTKLDKQLADKGVLYFKPRTSI